MQNTTKNLRAFFAGEVIK